VRTRTLLLAGLLSLAGCANVPFDYPRTASKALPPDAATPLGQTALQWRQDHGELSGFIGLPNGIEALGARLRLMEQARQSIDAQYFIIKRDRAGALFAGKLLRAADLGVRVRLLVDDIFSPGVDQPFALLDSHPNIEVRLFNPLSRRSFRYWSYLTDFRRANRRMHNKSFTVDNSMAIIGGRNIGEEYFELKQDIKFDDYEVFAIGAVVEQISAGFDEFWNSGLAVPMEAFAVKADPARLDDWREYIRVQVEESDRGIYSRAVKSTLLRKVRAGQVIPVTAKATMVTDSPDKLLERVGKVERATLAVEMGRRLRAAHREILIITPYYIPQDYGAELAEELLARGVKVVIVTNSLASTNHVPVHSGYARYRKRLLRAGAEIFEVRADIVGDESEWGHRPEMVTLHSKVSVIDRETIFVGSLNFDPRSILINSETGLFIESADAGADFAQSIFDELPRVAYKVELDERGDLRWTYHHGGVSETLDREPLASWGRRFMAGLYRLLPLESQL
jgi:putative cardiolipin synthase